MPTLDKKHTCVVQPGTRTGKDGRGGGMRGVKDKGMGVRFKNCIRLLCYLSASVKDQDDAFIQELQVPFLLKVT